MINCCVLITSFATFATTRYVRAGYSGQGFSWALASGDLQNTILSSQPGDTIWVAKGTYKPTTTSDRLFSFSLKQGVVMLGGFEGNELFHYLRDPATNPTILSGDIDSLGNNDSYHVLRRYSMSLTLTSLTILDGFTITGGRADDPSSQSGLPLPEGLGGGMYLVNASPAIRNCRFISNLALFEGGAVYTSNSSPIFTNCEFSLNRGTEADFIFGAAVSLHGQSETNFISCVFANNTALRSSSILATDNARIDATRCIFKENTSVLGGTIFTSNANSSHLPHSIDNSLFYLNNNNGSGEVIDIAALDSFKIVNCTFYNTQSPAGVSVANVGEIYNSIFWGCSISNFPAPSVSHSIVQGGYPGCIDCPGGNGNTDPLFVNVNDADGADNKNGTADDGLRLSVFSPGINSGLNISGISYIDVTGATRSGILDIGAYEGGVCQGNSVARLYVNASIIGSNGTGGSWVNAFTDLQIALEAARACNAAHEIWVAKGSYKPTATSDRTKYFSLINGVNIYGGFDGTETQLSQRNWTKNPTILSGNIDPSGNADSYRIIANSDLDSTAILDGFTVSGAYNNEPGGTSDGNGAGVFNFQSSPVFRNCSIRNNHAENVGGGMYNNVSSPLLINCAFAYNSSNGGGGMANYNSKPVLKNCVLAYNSSASNGGAMSNVFGSMPQLINCSVAKNTALAAGDGVYNQLGSSPVITNSLFWNNGGAGNEIVNQDVSSVPVVSYAHIEGGYAGCSNCTNPATNPNMINTDDADGADDIFGTLDDGLQLLLNSPCINAGNNAVATTLTDITNNPRIQNSTVNIGAYENNYIISQGNGSWNTAGTWNVNRAPEITDWVMIKAGHIITVLTGGANGPAGLCHGMVIMQGAKLDLTGKLNVE